MNDIIYDDFPKWYEGLYKDETAPCSAARSFAMLHEEKPDECWLLVHGYRGYPGELVSPAKILYEAGADVFVPRLPGHGTSGADFIKTKGTDWIGVISNAFKDLKQKYDKVNMLGHSMGGSAAALVMKEASGKGRLVLASPSFENKQMNPGARIVLKMLSPFTPKVKCKWHKNPNYHLHYENAPCDEDYLGEEYFKWFFTKQLFDYRKICKEGLKAIENCKNEILIILPAHDHIISEPSAELYLKHGGNAKNIIRIEDGNHCIFYDKSVAAENQALNALYDFALMNHNSSHNFTVGLPQGMPYHRYGQLWRSFFDALGVHYIISDPTTMKTLETGSDAAVDETCLAMKIYLGHVASLIGKCDYILAPRLSNCGRKKEMCPHFEGMYDIVRNTFRGSGQKFITYQLDEMHGLTERSAFSELGKELGFTATQSDHAYMTAKKEEQQVWSLRIQKENQKLKSEKIKVFIAAHSYVLEDAYIGKPVRDFLDKNDVVYIAGYIGDREQAIKNSEAFSQTCKWETSRELLGNLYLRQKKIDGVILISTFPCGSDAMVNDLLMRQLQGMPVLNLVMDSQSGTAGIETRLESFIDIIRFKREMM